MYVLSLRHKKNMLGKSKQEITLTHRKEKAKCLRKIYEIAATYTWKKRKKLLQYSANRIPPLGNIHVLRNHKRGGGR